MDVFNHNWNQRMKTESFVNYTLNTDTPDTIQTLGVQKKDRKRKRFIKIKDNQQYSPALHNEALKYLRDHPPIRRDYLGYDEDQLEQVVLYRNGVLFKSPKLYDNSRPNSLYNLNYATLR